MAENFVETWRARGVAEIPVHYRHFRELLAVAEDHLRRGRYDMAAVSAAIAARHACSGHAGIFVSHDLERLLTELAEDALPPLACLPAGAAERQAERVLHVATEIGAVGGLSRMLHRWIVHDVERQHSIALTSQSTRAIPISLSQALANQGGEIHFLDGVVGGLVARAAQLRRIASSFDYVVLHIAAGDVVAFLAFAGNHTYPPVIFVNHADHQFWLGSSVSNIVANLRRSGDQLSRQRRGIVPERNMLLPTLICASDRVVSREKAKYKLGLPENSLVMLSVARSIKYQSVGHETYAGVHVPVLQRYPGAILVVVGAGVRPEWDEAKQTCRGRIISLEERQNVEEYFQAADVYVDSFPFVSITSLLEAGTFGVPLVTRFPYSAASSILGADMPGLDGNLVVTRSAGEYQDQLCRLLDQETERERIGNAIRKDILNHHCGASWQLALEAIYERARTLGPIHCSADTIEAPYLGEPDVFIQSVFGGTYDRERCRDRLIEDELGVMPAPDRFKHWVSLRGRRSGPSGRWGSAVQLLPHWLRSRVGRWRRSFGRERLSFAGRR